MGKKKQKKKAKVPGKKCELELIMEGKNLLRKEHSP